ncbi:MAG: hypothetical protein AAGA02_03120 [Bacteroidota bacterium]
MYRLHKNLSNVRYYDFYKELIITIDEESRNFITYDLALNRQFCVEGSFEGILVLNDLLLDYSLEGWDLVNNLPTKLFENLQYAYSDDQILISKKVNYEKRQVNYFLSKLNDLNSYRDIDLKANPVASLGESIICRKEGIIVYDINSSNILWTCDVGQIASYEDYDGHHSGQIKQVYSWQDKVLISVTHGIICFDVSSGSIIWHTKFDNYSPNELHLLDEKIYLAQGIYYAVIDLESGRKIIDTTFGNNVSVGEKIIPMLSSRPDIAYYNNKIWHLDTHDSQYYLFAHEPDTGSIVHKQLLKELKAPCDTPRFSANRMYILDNKKTLHIYAK